MAKLTKPDEDAQRHDQTDPVDERFRALLEGLRTTLPGVQVLFAFLLTLPFQSAFSELSDVERGTYYLAFSMSAITSVLLIAPSVHQRMRAPLTGVERRSESHLRTAVHLTIAGTGTFLIALGASIYLATTIVLDDVLASVAVAMVLALALWSWVYLPLVSFRRSAD